MMKTELLFLVFILRPQNPLGPRTGVARELRLAQQLTMTCAPSCAEHERVANAAHALMTPLVTHSCQTDAFEPVRPLDVVSADADLQDECELMPAWALRAGARRKIYFQPSSVTAAIVTCGGLCPGLNDVVQGLVQKLTDYGVPEGGILGIR